MKPEMGIVDEITLSEDLIYKGEQIRDGRDAQIKRESREQIWGSRDRSFVFQANKALFFRWKGPKRFDVHRETAHRF